MTDQPGRGLSADPAHEIGVVLLQSRGLPRLDAEVAMLTDPLCRAAGERLVPPLRKLAQAVAELLKKEAPDD